MRCIIDNLKNYLNPKGAKNPKGDLYETLRKPRNPKTNVNC